MKNLEKLLIEGILENERNEQENETTGVFGQVFNGMHGRNGVVTGEAFTPDNSHLKTYLLNLAQLSPRSRDGESDKKFFYQQISIFYELYNMPRCCWSPS